MAYTVDTSAVMSVKRGTLTIISENDITTGISEDEAQSQFSEVADLTVDQAISLGGITTCVYLLMISDQTVSIKINNSATAIPGKVFFFKDTAITSLSVSNSSGNVANIRTIMAGI